MKLHVILNSIKISSLAVLFMLMLIVANQVTGQTNSSAKPATNINDAMKYKRNQNSMPGMFPAKVVQINNDKCITDNKIVYQAAYNMIAKGMKELTGTNNLKEAWLKFVSPKDRIGLKVNPVAGPTLTTSLEVTEAIINQLLDAGIPKDNIIIWDRRQPDLIAAGFTKEKFPGI